MCVGLVLRVGVWGSGAEGSDDCDPSSLSQGEKRKARLRSLGAFIRGTCLVLRNDDEGEGGVKCRCKISICARLMIIYPVVIGCKS